ncbi:hypothetical protein HNP84_002837 [Thermocatellispora tengchongensis]|uniref:Uncharacterized protein n=1 Tax=Thermocatellispora tengchongensis TaxID=1073253 RepID=A0A840P3N5_9ACTN|nr:hypothetical protein [Thermocatellispora tengchongensis]MBB5133116.1 hypothetical protein [Thermocatellispora tengchongensis]
MTSRPRYADHRAYVVPDHLGELTGPTAGVVTLPSHLDWSEQHTYDLSDEAQAGLMYERVIREAVRPEDLRLLNAAVLKRLWRRIFLPHRARQAWESRFSDLTRAA